MSAGLLPALTYWNVKPKDWIFSTLFAVKGVRKLRFLVNWKRHTSESLKNHMQFFSMCNSSCKNWPSSAATRHLASSLFGIVSILLVGATLLLAQSKWLTHLPSFSSNVWQYSAAPYPSSLASLNITIRISLLSGTYRGKCTFSRHCYCPTQLFQFYCNTGGRVSVHFIPAKWHSFSTNLASSMKGDNNPIRSKGLASKDATLMIVFSLSLAPTLHQAKWMWSVWGPIAPLMWTYQKKLCFWGMNVHPPQWALKLMGPGFSEEPESLKPISLLRNGLPQEALQPLHIWRKLL